MSEPSHVRLILSVASVLLLAVPAAAQDPTTFTNTRLEVSEPDDVDDWDGDAVTRRVETRLCWEGAGENPDDAEIIIETSVDAPDWIQVSAPGELRFTPPAETGEAGCSEPQTVDLTLQAGEVRSDGPFQVALEFRGRAADDDNATYQAPEDESAAFQVTAASAADDEAPTSPPPADGDGDGDGEADGAEAGDEDDEDRFPYLLAIVFIAALLLVLGALFATRR